jgi:hypothetical protein
MEPKMYCCLILDVPRQIRLKSFQVLRISLFGALGWIACVEIRDIDIREKRRFRVAMQRIPNSVSNRTAADVSLRKGRRADRVQGTDEPGRGKCNLL